MDQKITRLRQEIEQLDEKIQREEAREQILQARHRKKEKVQNIVQVLLLIRELVQVQYRQQVLRLVLILM